MLFIGKPKGRSMMISNATNPLKGWELFPSMTTCVISNSWQKMVKRGSAIGKRSPLPQRAGGKKHPVSPRAAGYHQEGSVLKQKLSGGKPLPSSKNPLFEKSASIWSAPVGARWRRALHPPVRPPLILSHHTGNEESSSRRTTWNPLECCY